MPSYRVCKRFTVESGHMLSKHPDRCRRPHGHTRTIEVVVRSSALDSNDMVLDFKALRLAIEGYLDQFDHSMALNAADPMRGAIESLHPGGVVVFEGEDPTTEVMARRIYEHVSEVLAIGFVCDSGGVSYSIPAAACELERVRVWETPSSWAEYGS